MQRVQTRVDLKLPLIQFVIMNRTKSHFILFVNFLVHLFSCELQNHLNGSFGTLIGLNAVGTLPIKREKKFKTSQLTQCN
jgi:hypothetical protein